MSTEEKQKAKCYLAPPLDLPKRKIGSKQTKKITLQNEETTTVGEYLKFGDESIIIGDGHVPTTIKSIRVVGNQIQIGGKFKDKNGKIQQQYEQPKKIFPEYYANVYFMIQEDLDKEEITIFDDSYLDKMKLPTEYITEFKVNEIAQHKPLPYIKYGKVQYPPIAPVKIISIEPNTHAFDCTPEIEIEPYEHTEFWKGWTHLYLIRKANEPTDNWNVSFYDLMLSKIERAEKLGVHYYLRNHCLSIAGLPLYLQKGSSFYGNKSSFTKFKILLNEQKDDTDFMQLMFEESMNNLGKVGINERLYVDIGGGTIVCTHSKQNMEFAANLTNYLYEKILRRKYLEGNQIAITPNGKGYNLESTFCLDTVPVFVELFGPTNLSKLFKCGSISTVSKLEDITLSYNTKKSMLIIKKFSFICD
eukprot:73343_1